MTKNIQEQVLKALKNPDFPDLQFLYSQEALKSAPEILEQLLDDERRDFNTKLKTPEDEISFELFDDFSLLDYYFSLLEHYQGVHSDEVIRKIIEDFEPKYIDFQNEVSYSKRYYEMLKICLEKMHPLSLEKGEDSGESWEKIRIITKSIEVFEVRGIALPESEQDELKEISKQLSEISQKFSNNVVDSKKEFEYIITDASIISEMPEDDTKAALNRAKNKKVEWYLFDSSQGSYMSVMKYCSDSSVRQHFYEFRHKVATTGEHDNTENILKTLKLRNRKAELLGFKNYAELSLKFKMAESPEQIIELFSDISKRAKPKSEAELKEIREYFNLTDLQIWDLSYYANILRKEKYELDDRELKKYFEFDSVLAGMFKIIDTLYGLTMKKLEIQSYNDDVQVYEVSRNGEFLSYFFTDYFYNELKRPGAWANIVREKHWEYKKITLNVCNFQKSKNEKTLLTLSDVETMFHEFGHATHEMLSRSAYSDLSGFHVEWDFVELPSQLLENWCRALEGMNIFAKHVDTGERVPEEMFEKLEKLKNFGSWEFVIAQNTYAMMDMWLHSQKIPETRAELESFINKNYDDHASFPRGDVYSPHTTFTHVFDGWYAAGYYSYMWAEIIEKEVWKAFKDSWDIFSPEVATKFHDTILSAGTTKKASELFRDFFWRDVEIDAFLEEKGLV